MAGTSIPTLNWTVDTAARQPGAPPPAFPANQLPTLQLLYQAAALQADIGDPTAMRSYPNLRTNCMLLQLHAINEARAGRFAQAGHDIATIQTMARHLGQDPMGVASLVATMADGIACQTIAAVLPLAKDERDLDALPLQARDWYRSLGQHRARYFHALRLHFLCQAYTGGFGALGWTDRVLRLLVARGELEFVDRHFARFEQCWQQPTDRQWAVSLAEGGKACAYDFAAPFSSSSLQRSLDSYVGAQEQVKAQIQHDLAEAAIAATRYRLKTGALPQSWDDLRATGLVATIPIDPETSSPITLSTRGSQTIFVSRSVSFCAASRPLWEIFATGAPASTQPATRRITP
jgi:hypothetical protein